MLTIKGIDLLLTKRSPTPKAISKSQHSPHSTTKHIPIASAK